MNFMYTFTMRAVATTNIYIIPREKKNFTSQTVGPIHRYIAPVYNFNNTMLHRLQVSSSVLLDLKVRALHPDLILQNRMLFSLLLLCR